VTQNNKDWLIEKLTFISQALKEGRYQEIDLSSIEQEAEALAANFKDVIESLQSVGFRIGTDSTDVQRISDHLKHISKSTEEGVMRVMDSAEGIIDDATVISSSLEGLGHHLVNDEARSEYDQVTDRLGSLQTKAFTIMTSLEFEDINRQQLEKILTRLGEIYDNLMKVLLLLKLKDKITHADSRFIDGIRRISDPEQNNHQQDTIDALLNEFGL
jgi:chemotaxis regulatin CheY-phosphate phosphatase CheZ